MNRKLEGKSALITGAGQGLGEATALQFGSGCRMGLEVVDGGQIAVVANNVLVLIDIPNRRIDIV